MHVSNIILVRLLQKLFYHLSCFFCLFFVRRDSLQKLDLFILHIIFISIIHMSKHNFIGIL